MAYFFFTVLKVKPKLESKLIGGRLHVHIQHVQYTVCDMSVTCDVFFDLVDLADGVVASEHVQVERLRVFSHTGPCANVRSGPPEHKTSFSET